VHVLIWWATNVAALFVASALVPGIDYGDDVWILLLAGFVFGVVNLVVRPIVILLALPAIVLTLGIALLLVNALMLYLTDLIVGGFEAGGFWSAVGGAVVVWLVNLVLHALVGRDRWWRSTRPARPAS
jgi:putative membrane protein